MRTAFGMYNLHQVFDVSEDNASLERREAYSRPDLCRQRSWCTRPRSGSATAGRGFGIRGAPLPTKPCVRQCNDLLQPIPSSFAALPSISGSAFDEMISRTGFFVN